METTTGFDMLGTWSTPSTAPFVPPFPIRYRNVRILTAVYRTDPDAVRAHLPDALEPTSDRVMVHFYDMPDVQHLGKVNECNVMLGARLRDRPEVVGGFSTVLFISSDVGLAQGREVHGQPKKLAKTSLRTRGDLTVATTRRNGIRVLRATTPYKQRPSAVDEISAVFPFRTNLNAKIIRHIDGTLAIAQITSRELVNVEVHECWTGPLTMEISPNAQVPVHLLPVLEAVSAFEWTADFELHPGRVELDLLAP